MTKILSWNVNGLRSVCQRNFYDWFEEEKADVVCLQEIKAHPENLDEKLVHPGSYHSYWHPAQRPGYSGVVSYCRKEPVNIKLGIGDPKIDSEGRVVVTEFPEFSLINAYFPNSQRDHARLDYKLAFCKAMLKLCQSLRGQGRNLVICGDFNIAHQEIDLANPRGNRNNAGFLPQERAWISDFIAQGYVDTFREFTKAPGHYTWWSFRPRVRSRNIGWRLDYHYVSAEFRDRVKMSAHQPQIYGSDHCPIILKLRN